MSQIILRPHQRTGDRFRLDGDEAHHLVNVLRKSPGDEIAVFDGEGRRFRATITAIDAAQPSAEGQLVEEIRIEPARVRLRLFQGLPKGTKFDFVIEKAVELGAAQILPFLSQKSLIKLDDKQARAKALRWKRLAEAAAKQCDRADIPNVSPAALLGTLADEIGVGTTILLSTSPGATPLRRFLREKGGESGIINVVVGPESGLTSAEEKRLVGLGAVAVSLGARILRTETAGLAALAILQYELNSSD
ncbi:MAG: 16S rRNA (uracil(1498)-N(3))-methyltransferase [Elusimicrobia bacterium]|nr:16S rRNA (uracil(1498)-N(3))-methyltransferase [Elusimicrobiota bacterium]